MVECPYFWRHDLPQVFEPGFNKRSLVILLLRFQRQVLNQIYNMQQTIHISTPAHNGLYDITPQVEAIVSESAAGGPAW